MNMDEKLEQELAEYIAGEMPEAARRAFEERLASDPALAAEARSLAGALLALRSLDEGEGAGDIVGSVTARSAVARADRRGDRQAPAGAWPAVRMAAAIAIAFGAGVLARGLMFNGGGAAPTGAPVATNPSGHGDGVARPDAPGWETRLAQSYLSSSAGSSDLGRSFAALARVTRGGGGGGG